MLDDVSQVHRVDNVSHKYRDPDDLYFDRKSVRSSAKKWTIVRGPENKYHVNKEHFHSLYIKST